MFINKTLEKTRETVNFSPLKMPTDVHQNSHSTRLKMVRQAVSEGNSETSSFVSFGVFLKFFCNYSCNKNSADYMLVIELRSAERIAQAQV